MRFESCAGEVTQDVYYLDAAIERGVVKSIRLSFERPHEAEAPNQREALWATSRQRHPGLQSSSVRSHAAVWAAGKGL